jgi:sugar lactone lactonase YvrE
VRLAAATACLALALCAPARADDYAAIHARAAEAWQAQDMSAFRAAVVDALAVRPDYPPMLFNLALAESRLGHAAQAVRLLERLARMGLTVPANAATFPDLAGLPSFAAAAEALEANAEPLGAAVEAARVEDSTGFLPEGIAADPATGDLFVGSVRQARVVRIDAGTGESTDFAGSDPERLWGVFGMRVDGDVLWVASSAVDETPAAPETARGRAAVLGYDLADGALLFRCEFDGPAVLGDVLPEGEGAWVSDSIGGVWYVRARDCDWRELVPAGALVSPQGLAPGDAGHLLVADYRGGLYRVARDGGALARIDTPEDVTVYGIDGLDRRGEWLVAIQNGLAPHRVLALRLSAEGDRVLESRVLARALPDFDEPTLGVVHAGRFLFVANSGWYRYGPDPRPPGGPPVVLSVDLPKGD